jgi:hypothetical protein
MGWFRKKAPEPAADEFDCFDEFERLLVNFASLRAKAAAFAKAEGDEFIRIARAGFAVHGAPRAWRKEHATIITDYVLACRAQGDSERVLLFYALAHGMVLGAYASELLDEVSYRKAWILLPGFVMGKTREIEA